MLKCAKVPYNDIQSLKHEKTYTTACKPHLLKDPHYEKPAFCLREKHTEAADQLCVNRTADQILCFRDIDSRISKLAKFHVTQSGF